MPESVCGERLRQLHEEAVLLRAHREELAEALEADEPESLTPDQVARLHRLAKQTLARGSLAKRRALLGEFVHEIRVHGRERIDPVFRVPSDPPEGSRAKARARTGSVGSVGLTDVGSNLPLIEVDPVALSERHATGRRRDSYPKKPARP